MGKVSQVSQVSLMAKWCDERSRYPRCRHTLNATRTGQQHSIPSPN
jgi:hypothetical protein